MSQPAPFLDLLQLCSINLSAVSLGDEEFFDFVEGELAGSGVPAAKLCFEITETAAIENLAQAQRLMAQLAARGVRFALDDFGTGMSSYSYLKELPVSLPQDRRQVHQGHRHRPARPGDGGVDQPGGARDGDPTVAEGVTSAAVVERLRALGVDFAQGNWISPPRPLAGMAVATRR